MWGSVKLIESQMLSDLHVDHVPENSCNCRGSMSASAVQSNRKQDYDHHILIYDVELPVKHMQALIFVLTGARSIVTHFHPGKLYEFAVNCSHEA